MVLNFFRQIFFLFLLLVPVLSLAQVTQYPNPTPNLAAPGPIGGTTPSTVKATTITVTAAGDPKSPTVLPTIGAIEPTNTCISGCVGSVGSMLLSGAGPPEFAPNLNGAPSFPTSQSISCPYADCLWTTTSGDAFIEFNHTLPFVYILSPDNTVGDGHGVILAQNNPSFNGLGAIFSFVMTTDASTTCYDPASGSVLSPSVPGPCAIDDVLYNASTNHYYPRVIALDGVLPVAAFQKDSCFFALDETTPKKWLQCQDSSGVLTTTINAGTTDTLTVNGIITTSGYTIATLPTCNATTKGATAYITNGQTSPGYLGAVSTTGTTIAPVFCNGSGWVYH